MKTKTCTRCGRTLPVSEFGKHKLGIDGLNYWCKECNKERSQEYMKTASGVYTSIKSRVKHTSKNPQRWGRDKPFNIARDEFIVWYNGQLKECEYCEIKEEDLSKIKDRIISRANRLTIDCKDNDQGYILGNLALSCMRCNYLKNDFLSYEEMKEIGQKYVKPKWEKQLGRW